MARHAETHSPFAVSFAIPCGTPPASPCSTSLHEHRIAAGRGFRSDLLRSPSRKN